MIISVIVKPGAKRESVLEKNQEKEGEYVAFIREKPHDGEANKALLKMVSDYFSVPKTSIKIKIGAKSRKKVIEIEGK